MRFLKVLVGVASLAVIMVSVTGCAPVATYVCETTGICLATNEPAPAPATAEFIRVIDGDTIAVVPTAEFPATNAEGSEHVVRLLGIDTPEINKMSDEAAECGAEAAAEALASLLGQHPVVTITFDTASDHVDRYGRSLAYVEVDGIDVGKRQIETGMAAAWYPVGEPAPSRYIDYIAVHQLAEQQGLGSFGTCQTVGR